MHKIHITILTYMLVTAVSGQSYKPMLVNGNSWNVLYTQPYYTFKCGQSYPNTAYQKETEVFKLSGDTVIAGKTYKRLVSSFDSLTLIWNLLGFIREDTLEQKVYFKESYNYSEETLLYNFQLKVNESISGNFLYLTAQSIDSVLVGNSFSKRINFTNGNKWIEGVGDLKGPFEAILPVTTCGTPPNTNLLCVFNTNSLIYKNTATGLEKCSYWEILGVGTEPQIALIDYEIVPNPVDSYLNIRTSNQQNYEVEILNIQGNIVLKKAGLYKNELIPVGHLHAGLYFARISSKNKTLIYKVFKN